MIGKVITNAHDGQNADPSGEGNAAIKDGSLAKAIEHLTKLIHPEAVYFTAVGGKRTALFFFHMKDSSEVPVIAEIGFQALNAELEFTPVMNPDELQKGLGAAMAATG